MAQEKKSHLAIDDLRNCGTGVHDEVTSSKASPARGSLSEYLGTIYRDRWASIRSLLTSSANIAVLLFQRKKARLLASSTQAIRLHLGCGPSYKEGWINIDLALWSPTAVREWIARKRTGAKERLDLMWDLRRGLPFPDNSVEAIFSEHVMEHFDYGAGLALLKECHRVLQPGGVLRTGVPDLERYIHSYDGGDPIIDDVRPGRPTRAIALSEIFFHHGHRAMYDYETIAFACREAGFSSTEHSAFAQGHLGAEVDSEVRRSETLYVEATK
jgi:predicted SAM-dependent methyltransferase